MTEKKQKHLKIGWIIAAAAVFILLFAMFTANAATDGALFNGTLFQNLRVWLNGEEYEMNEYLDLVEGTTDQNGNPVVHYSYALPDGKSVDAYAAEEYTAFSVDAQDAGSIRITVDNADANEAVPTENHPAVLPGGDKE